MQIFEKQIFVIFVFNMQNVSKSGMLDLISYWYKFVLK